MQSFWDRRLLFDLHFLSSRLPYAGSYAKYYKVRCYWHNLGGEIRAQRRATEPQVQAQGTGSRHFPNSRRQRIKKETLCWSSRIWHIQRGGGTLVKLKCIYISLTELWNISPSSGCQKGNILFLLLDHTGTVWERIKMVLPSQVHGS